MTHLKTAVSVVKSVYSEDTDSQFLRNAGKHPPDYMAIQPKRPHNHDNQSQRSIISVQL